MIAIQARPAAVHPGAFHQTVVNSRIVLLDGAEDLEGAGKVLGVEPSAHRQHRAMNVLQVRSEIARLPIVIVSVVPHLIVPEKALVMEVARVGIGERPQLEEEIVGALRAVIKPDSGLRRGGIFQGLETGVETKVGVEHESSAMVGVVTHEEIGHGSLR